MALSFLKASAPLKAVDGHQRTLVLIDYADHSRGGHFGPYLIWFVREFSQRFDTVLVLTPMPANTEKLLQLSDGNAPKNVFCHQLPKGPRKRLFSSKHKPAALAKIFKTAAKLVPSHKLHAFIMWGYDLLVADVAKDHTGVPWATLGCISYLERGHTGTAADSEAKVKKLCEEHPDCASLLLWDQYVVPAGSKKLLWIPGYEDSRVSSTSDLAAAVRNHAAGRFCIGGFGILTGQRCLNELVQLAVQHPEISFALAGTMYEKSVREDLQPLLGDRKPDNLLIIRGYQQEEELNSAIQACDALLIDGVTCPVHSGILTKALLLGRCLLSPESNSWTCDMIKEHGVGISYQDRSSDLTQLWREWLASGGTERSTRIGNALVNDATIGHCFDTVTQRLTGGYPTKSSSGDARH